MANIFVLTEDAFLHVLRHLHVKDRIAFAYTCKWFRQICMDGGAFRKVDLSRCLVRRQEGLIKGFLRDKELHHIRELNLNNDRAINWQMDGQLGEFITSICPHLEALHVLNCGLSLQRLQRILQQAPKLTALSWSLLDIKPEDTDFLVKGIESSSAVCLANIRNLHFEVHDLKPHIEVLKYLVMCCCKYLEELEIYVWQLDSIYQQSTTQAMNKLDRDWYGLAILQPSLRISDPLQYMHSLTVVGLGRSTQSCVYSHHFSSVVHSHFIPEILRKKSREVKWKKYWISAFKDNVSPRNMFYLYASSVLLPRDRQQQLHPVKSFTAHTVRSQHARDDLTALFRNIDNNSIRHLHLCANYDSMLSEANSVLEICEPILSIGEALEFLSLSLKPKGHFLRANAIAAFNTLLSVCSNIMELDLVGCHFERNICEALNTLKFLLKIQLPQCAIFTYKNQCYEGNESLWTLVENCQNITDFEIRGCQKAHCSTYLNIVDDGLLPLAKLIKLESLTLAHILHTGTWASLKTISENCKFLTTLRIWILNSNLVSDIPIFHCVKFLRHLAVNMEKLDLKSEDVWMHLRCATNLERLCIRSIFPKSLNVTVTVATLKCLPRLHVLHLHLCHPDDFEVFRDQVIKMLEQENSDRRFFFELVVEYGLHVVPQKRWILNKALPLNEVELCQMAPNLEIPMF